MSKANYWEIHNTGGTGKGNCLCVHVSEGVYTNNRSRAAALRTPMFRCQQLGRLGFGGQLLSRQCLNPGTGGIHIARMYVFSTNKAIQVSHRKGIRMRPLVLFAFVQMLSVSVRICVSNYVPYMPACVCSFLRIHVQPH